MALVTQHIMHPGKKHEIDAMLTIEVAVATRWNASDTGEGELSDAFKRLDFSLTVYNNFGLKQLFTSVKRLINNTLQYV